MEPKFQSVKENYYKIIRVCTKKTAGLRRKNPPLTIIRYITRLSVQFT